MLFASSNDCRQPCFTALSTVDEAIGRPSKVHRSVRLARLILTGMTLHGVEAATVDLKCTYEAPSPRTSNICLANRNLSLDSLKQVLRFAKYSFQVLHFFTL
jgi:hypothetical protein